MPQPTPLASKDLEMVPSNGERRTGSHMDAGAVYHVGKRLLAWALAATLILLLMWRAWDFLLLAFGGLLLAILLVAGTEWLQRKTPLGRGASFTVIVACLLAVLGGLGALFAGKIAEQGAQMVQQIPEAAAQVRGGLEQSDWGRSLIGVIERGAQSLQIGQKASSLLQGLFEAVSGIIVIFVIGFFLALEPSVYRSGLLRLFAAKDRRRAQAAADEVEVALRGWLTGQIIAMAMLGATTYVGLLLLGIPLALVLSLLTAILIFIPYLGAVISEIPAVLVALLQGPEKAVEVVALYLGVHILEAYVLVPMVQHRTARLPPVVTILAQALMWTMAGITGITLAAPIAASAMALVKSLYLHEKSPETEAAA